MINYKHTYSASASILKAFPHTIPGMDEEHDLTTKEGRIGFVIEKCGHNPASIAKLLGCKPAAVYQWLDGSTKNLKEHLLWKLADTTGYDARWISTGEGPQRQKKYMDTRFAHVLDVMESLPPYVIDEGVREIEALADGLFADLSPGDQQIAMAAQHMPPGDLEKFIDTVRKQSAEKRALLAALMAQQHADETREPAPEEAPPAERPSRARKGTYKLSETGIANPHTGHHKKRSA